MIQNIKGESKDPRLHLSSVYIYNKHHVNINSTTEMIRMECQGIFFSCAKMLRFYDLRIHNFQGKLCLRILIKIDEQF